MTEDSPGWDGSTAPFTDRDGDTGPRRTLPTNTKGEISERSDFRTSVINLERPGDPTVFGAQVRADAATLIARYPKGQARSALLPMLHLVQAEQGHITPDGIAFCAEVLDLTKAQVSAVATFYTMYKRVPTGEYLVSVCTNTLCGLMGGDEIFNEIADELGIANNETTADGSVTLERAECLAACDFAPVVTVNYEFFDNQSVDSTRELVGELRSGRRPLPTRGAPLCSFREVERQIAGFFTDEQFALDAPATAPQTEAGVRLAIQRGDTAPSYANNTDEPKAGLSDQGTDGGSFEQTLIDVHSEEQPDDIGEFPLQTPQSEREARRGPNSGTTNGASGGSAAETSHREGPSESDAPLHTAESDPANSTNPAAEKED